MTSEFRIVELAGKAALDSRLARLAYAWHQPDLLAADLESNFVTADVGFDAAAPDAAKVGKRIIVRLRGENVPREFSHLKWKQIAGSIFTVSLPVTDIAALAASPEVEFMSAGNAMGPAMDTAVADTRVTDVRNAIGVTTRTGQGTLIGVIDFGFDYTLDDFRNSDGTTRIAAYWNQSIIPITGESSPSGFAYGVEYSQTNINTALAATNPFDVVRYNNPGQSPLGAGAHGTHVAGIAAANGRSADSAFPAATFIGAAPEARLILVQPDSSDVATSFTDSVHVADAVRYIFEKADELRLPCVINMSLGQNGGSHDGESVVERGIDLMLEDGQGRAMVVAGGNEHIFRGHASGVLSAGGERTLNWMVGGGMPIPGGATGTGLDRTMNEMEIWYSSRDIYSVSVIDPNGDATTTVDAAGVVSGAVVPGETKVFPLPSGDQVFIDSVRFSRLNGDSQIYIAVLPKPASATQPSNVTSGIWQVKLHAVRSLDGRFDAWIERDARDPQNSFADQSFFRGSDFDAVMTLGTPATNRRAVAVANYSHQSQSINDSSGRGRTRDQRAKPDVAAPGTNITSSNSMGGRTLPGSAIPVPMRTTKTGTSMSAPHVTGIVSLMFEVNPKLTADQVRKILIASARPPVGSVSTDFSNEFGYGRVDAVEALLAAQMLL